MIIEGRGVRRGVRLKFLATCRALLERKKRDHQAMVVAARPAAGLVVMTEVTGGGSQTPLSAFCRLMLMMTYASCSV